MATNQIFQVDHADAAVIVTPVKNLGELEYGEIERAGDILLDQISHTPYTNIVVDLQNTDYFGSTALGFFVRLWKRTRSRDGKLAFCNVSPMERDTLALTKLDTLWLMTDSRSDALEAVQKE